MKKNSKSPITITYGKTGATSVKVYLLKNDTVNKEVQFAVSPAPLDKIELRTEKQFEQPYNGKINEAILNLTGGQGLTAKDFTAEVTSGKENLQKDITFVDATEKDEDNKDVPIIKVQVQTKADGKDGKKVEFKIKSGDKASGVISITTNRASVATDIALTDFNPYVLRINKTASTDCNMLNQYGEKINDLVNPETVTYKEMTHTNKLAVNGVKWAKTGKLSVTALGQEGEARIILYVGDSAEKEFKITVYDTPTIKKLILGAASVDVIVGDSGDLTQKVTLQAEDKYGVKFNPLQSDIIGKISVLANDKNEALLVDETGDDDIIDCLKFYATNAENKQVEAAANDEVTHFGFEVNAQGKEIAVSDRKITFKTKLLF